MTTERRTTATERARAEAAGHVEGFHGMGGCGCRWCGRIWTDIKSAPPERFEWPE